MRKNFGSKSWFYPLPVLILGTYNPDGTPFIGDPRGVLKRALKRAGLPAEIRFHDLRHTCAALLVLADASPKEVSEYLGHANAAFTMDIYADIFDKQKEATAQKLDRLLRIKQSV